MENADLSKIKPIQDQRTQEKNPETTPPSTPESTTQPPVEKKSFWANLFRRGSKSEAQPVVTPPPPAEGATTTTLQQSKNPVAERIDQMLQTPPPVDGPRVQNSQFNPYTAAENVVKISNSALPGANIKIPESPVYDYETPTPPNVTPIRGEGLVSPAESVQSPPIEQPQPPIAKVNSNDKPVA